MPKSKYTKGKNNLYQTKVTIGIDASTGKIIRKSIYAKTSKELEILKLKYDEKYQFNKNSYINHQDTLNTTMSQLTDKWFTLFQENKEHNTQEMYLTAIKHINDSLGYYLIRNISQEDIQLLINKHFSKPCTCKKIMLTLKQLFNYAIDLKIIEYNPCYSKMIKLPIYKPTEKRALLSEELDAIKYISDFTDKEKFLLYMLYYFGLRPEEIKALKPGDFDFSTNTVTVSRAAIYNSNEKKMIIKGTKTRAGYRKMYIPLSAQGFLNEYITQIKEKTYCLSSKFSDIITNTSYRILFNNIVDKIQKYNEINYLDYISEDEYNLLLQNSKRNKKKIFLNVNNLTSYTFRRNYATMLYYSNVTTKQAAKLMGHTDIQMILTVYAQLDELKENLNDKLDNLISIN